MHKFFCSYGRTVCSSGRAIKRKPLPMYVMNNAFKLVALGFVFLVFVISPLFLIEPALAQTKPSIPEFTLEFVPDYYETPSPSYTINPFTGQTGPPPDIRPHSYSIQITIKNQQFSTSLNGINYHLYYNIRFKGHFTEDWAQLYSLTEASDSEYTVLRQPATYFPNSQLDYQIQAVLGRDSIVDESSGWSQTQTIIIPEASSLSFTPPTATAPPASATPTPIQNPTFTPPADTALQKPASDQSASMWPAVIVAVMAALIAISFAVLVAMQRKMRKPSRNNT